MSDEDEVEAINQALLSAIGHPTWNPSTRQTRPQQRHTQQRHTLQTHHNTHDDTHHNTHDDIITRVTYDAAVKAMETFGMYPSMLPVISDESFARLEAQRIPLSAAKTHLCNIMLELYLHCKEDGFNQQMIGSMPNVLRPYGGLENQIQFRSTTCNFVLLGCVSATARISRSCNGGSLNGPHSPACIVAVEHFVRTIYEKKTGVPISIESKPALDPESRHTQTSEYKDSIELTNIVVKIEVDTKYTLDTTLMNTHLSQLHEDAQSSRRRGATTVEETQNRLKMRIDVRTRRGEERTIVATFFDGKITHMGISNKDQIAPITTITLIHFLVNTIVS